MHVLIPHNNDTPHKYILDSVHILLLRTEQTLFPLVSLRMRGKIL